jgi:hypothetical protein
VPADGEFGQMLPAGDLSIFADLGLDEMWNWGVTWADLTYRRGRPRFGDAVERARYRLVAEGARLENV